MKIHINDRFMEVSEADRILILSWKKETSDLTSEYFKDEALKFIDAVKKSKIKNIIVDMREFHYTLSPELVDWRNKNIISVYNRVGIEKFAFIGGKSSVKQDDPANRFVTRHFLTKQEAKDWILSQ